ncbi:MAG: hypothetical protein WBV80_06020 [Mycobacterium sp.]
MTSTTVSRHTDSARRQSIRADLVFWTAAGAVVAALSEPVAHWWQAPRAVLLDVGLTFAVLGPLLLLGLYRMRRVSRGLVASFVVTNLLLAPLTAAAAWFDWLGLSAAGNWALADAAAVMLVLGVWQFAAVRRG